MSEPSNNINNKINENIPKDNVIPIASKQISDVIQFQEPTTSKNYSFKTEIRINILGEPKSDSNDSVTLSLFDESEAQRQKDQIPMEESYVTMDSCLKEKTTNTNEAVMFSRNERTQRAIVINSEAPPPYNSHPPPAYSSPSHRTINQPQHQQYHQNYPGSDGFHPYGHDSPSALELQIRHNFVQKVFLILTVQLLITCGMILLVMFHEDTRKFVAGNRPMFWVMSAMEIVIYIALMCYQATRRIFPLNFILLLLFTIALSYICAAATAFYSTKVILISVAGTASICFVVALLAWQKRFDVTKCGFIIVIASIVFVVFGLIVLIVSLISFSPILWLVYAGMATLLFSVFLLYDMQCILGGRRHEISPEEYIYAALTLYVDIVMIFMYLLELVNACSR